MDIHDVMLKRSSETSFFKLTLFLKIINVDIYRHISYFQIAAELKYHWKCHNLLCNTPMDRHLCSAQFLVIKHISEIYTIIHISLYTCRRSPVVCVPGSSIAGDEVCTSSTLPKIDNYYLNWLHWRKQSHLPLHQRE